MLSHIDRPYTVEAPVNVVVNLFRQSNREILHVMNVPPAFFTLGISHQHQQLPTPMLPHDVIPTGAIEILLPKNYDSVFSPTHPSLEMSCTKGLTRIRLDSLEQHAVVVLEASPSPRVVAPIDETRAF